MNESGIRSYHQTAVGSVGPEKLIVLLYDGLIRYLRLARGAIAGGDRRTTTRQIDNAQSIVVELMRTLDPGVANELTASLDALYRFVFTENLKALIDGDPAHVDHALRVLEPLREAWAGIPPGAAERALRERQQPLARPAAGPVPAHEAEAAPAAGGPAEPAEAAAPRAGLCVSA